MPFIVEIEPGCWLAVWKGDPGRTYGRHAARLYRTRRGANLAAARAARLRPGLKPKIVDVGDE